MTNKASGVRLRSRIWSILRAIVFVCVIVFIWMGMAKTATAFVGIALVMGWVNLFQLRSQEIEKPYYRLWLNFIDGLLQFSVMTSIFVRELILQENTEKLLGVGCTFLLARLIANNLFNLGVLREGKSLPFGKLVVVTDKSCCCGGGIAACEEIENLLGCGLQLFNTFGGKISFVVGHKAASCLLCHRVTCLSDL